MSTIITTKAAASKYIGRRTARVFRPDAIQHEVETRIATAAQRAAEGKNDLSWSLDNGGAVANKYDYPAYSQVLFVAAMADGRALVVVANIPANKITMGGSIEAAIGSAARPALDNRYGEAATKAAREYIDKYVREQLADAGNVWVG